ncbi:hypothetical protein BC832DRAFT_589724 [Gaertneriomyces semiglobifer]|nr:hypothetical protein BC832DRAFT_589724 [Gaertneriomyces semiglobifer]
MASSVADKLSMSLDEIIKAKKAVSLKPHQQSNRRNRNRRRQRSNFTSQSFMLRSADDFNPRAEWARESTMSFLTMIPTFGTLNLRKPDLRAELSRWHTFGRGSRNKGYVRNRTGATWNNGWMNKNGPSSRKDSGISLPEAFPSNDAVYQIPHSLNISPIHFQDPIPPNTKSLSIFLINELALEPEEQYNSDAMDES